MPERDGSAAGRAVWLFGLGATGTVGACFLLAAPPSPVPPRVVPPSRLRPAEWALPVGLLVGLFVLRLPRARHHRAGRVAEPLRSCALGPIAARSTSPDGWREANLSRAQARDVLTCDRRAPHPVVAPTAVPCGRR